MNKYFYYRFYLLIPYFLILHNRYFNALNYSDFNLFLKFVAIDLQSNTVHPFTVKVASNFILLV